VAFPPDLEQRLAARVAALGFALVELRLGGASRRPLLAVRIERPDAGPDARITVGDCAVVSRDLEAWLDAEVFAERLYVLEVSSPGLDRPLRRLEEWRRFAGRRADVLAPALGGRFAVRIVGVAEGSEPAVELEFPKGEHRIVRLAEIKEARLAIEWPARVERHG